MNNNINSNINLNEDNIIWFYQNLEICYGTKKIGLHKNMKYVIWNNEIIPIELFKTNKRYEYIDFYTKGLINTQIYNNIYWADGRLITINCYKVNNKMYIKDINFSNINFTK